MEFPVWDVDVGYGILMAVFGVVHVTLSHFAIGGGLYLVWTERAARRSGDAARLAFVRRLSGFFAPATLVAGALTGVGIWFVIGLLNPTATQALIHAFVWAWAIEWTFFAVEILAAILYAKGWDRLSPRAHQAFGWVYFVSAWASLLVINGIVSFMATPGRWPETGAFWDGWLNPTFASSLVLRTAICVLMAGLFAGWVAAGERDPSVRARLSRGTAAWGLAGLLGAAGSFLWWRAALPEGMLRDVGVRLTIPYRQLRVLGMIAPVLAVGLAAVVLLPRMGRRSVAAALVLLGFGAFGTFEWYRESIRKPWAIFGVVYGNGVEADRVASYAAGGALAAIPTRTGDDGRDLFLHQCRACHTLRGYNPVLPSLDGTTPEHVGGVLAGLHEMRAKMPPFVGDDREREVLARWLWERTDRTPLAERARREGTDLGALVYRVRCSVCHVVGGHNDKRPSVAAWDEDDLRTLLEESMGKEMPPFTGDEAEREALIRHLLSWKEVPR